MKRGVLILIVILPFIAGCPFPVCPDQEGYTFNIEVQKLDASGVSEDSLIVSVLMPQRDTAFVPSPGWPMNYITVPLDIEAPQSMYIIQGRDFTDTVIYSYTPRIFYHGQECGYQLELQDPQLLRPPRHRHDFEPGAPGIIPPGIRIHL